MKYLHVQILPLPLAFKLFYVECAKEIINSVEKMNNNTINHHLPTILMSSLSFNEKLMWSGAKRKAENSNVKEALEMLLLPSRHLRIFKLDVLIEKQKSNDKVVDSGMMAVYDLILASEAKQFATCNHRCRNRTCSKCNYIGRFADVALDHRKHLKNSVKTSHQCWL